MQNRTGVESAVVSTEGTDEATFPVSNPFIMLLEKLEAEGTLSFEEWVTLLDALTAAGSLAPCDNVPEIASYTQGADSTNAANTQAALFAKHYLFARARTLRDAYYGNRVYVRGLIEFSNYCKNNCYYCGIRRENRKVRRYRLSPDQILSCAEEGYELGFRTFVLQGGEDPYYNDDLLEEIVSRIHQQFPDCALTLSLGERSKESYRRLREAGATRYLLRHETATDEHYRALHPPELSLANRKHALYTLRDLGYQVGSGFMVGSPGQTTAHLAQDMLFLHDLQPHMVGIGPFIPHAETPFAHEQAGTLDQTLTMLALLRLMLPKALLPATTALGTIDPRGREMGIQAGANVVMPNLSPVEFRKDYSLYDNKICTGEEAAECRFCLQARMASIGHEVVVDRGDSKVDY